VRLVLLGLMGAGKSTIARELAGRLGWPWVDNDAQVEAATGSTARQLSGHEGLERLHEIEAQALRDALARPAPAIVTAAASVVDDPATGPLLAEHTVTVWLRARPETLAERVRHDPGRPLLAAGRDVAADDVATTLATLTAQMAARGDRFAALADVVVDVDGCSPGEVADAIVAALAQRSRTAAAAPEPPARPPG
jgi:shikimate kinase